MKLDEAEPEGTLEGTALNDDEKLPKAMFDREFAPADVPAKRGGGGEIMYSCV